MKLQQYFDVSQSNDLDIFRKRLIDFAYSMDFSIVTACLVAPSGAMTATGNIPENFKSISDDFEVGRRSPVVKRLKALAVPFTYDQTLYTSEGLGEDWEVQAPFGYSTGIAVAIHLPHDKHFLLGMDRSHALPQDEERIIRLLADLQLLAVHAQSAGLRLLDHVQTSTLSENSAAGGALHSDRMFPEPAIHLTTREREVLKWAMDGKSAWATGQILCLSENTVKFHIKGAMRKLHSGSRIQAVLKAIEMGLI